MNVASETGGAFMNPSKCDADGNLYIRKYVIGSAAAGAGSQDRFGGQARGGV